MAILKLIGRAITRNVYVAITSVSALRKAHIRGLLLTSVDDIVWYQQLPRFVAHITTHCVFSEAECGCGLVGFRPVDSTIIH